MKKEQSYGIVPLRLQKGHWEVLLIQHHAGHWSFPKGHTDGSETPKQTAERELQEETGLAISKFLTPEPLKENYIFTSRGEKISKTVDYFLALVNGHVEIQRKEIQASEWLDLTHALERMTFKEGKRLCAQVHEFLKTLDEHGHPLLAKKPS